METFQKEVKFISQILEGGHLVKKEVTKVATFKELDRTDEKQHTLHFKILSLYQNRVSTDDDEDEVDYSDPTKKIPVKLDSDALYDLTVKCIKTLSIVDETRVDDTSFIISDKKEFLKDSIAILNFGLWFLSEHITPFFIQSKTT